MGYRRTICTHAWLIGRSLAAVHRPLSILFQDDDLVAVDKPSGLVVHRGWAGDDKVAMTVVRDQIGQRVFPVHRLDRGTSGVLLFALSPGVAASVAASFADGLVEKSYLALVRGIPPTSGLIDHPLPPGEDKKEARVPAQTRFVRREIFGRYSLVELSPLTGRLHQVRRHMKHLSCPLIGDVNYGKGEHNRFFREQYGLYRLFLHAARMRLPHPRKGGTVEIGAPLSPELECVLAMLRDPGVRLPHPPKAAGSPLYG